MKKLFIDYYQNIKERNKAEKSILLIEGIILLVFSLLVLIFNLNKPSTLTILYLFPIALIFISMDNIYFASKAKEIDNKFFLIYIIESIFYLLIVLYLIFNPIKDKYFFIIILSSYIIFRNILKLFKTKVHSILEYFNIAVMIIISILCIVFNQYIINNLYLYLILFYLIYGIIKIVLYSWLNKKTKK